MKAFTPFLALFFILGAMPAFAAESVVIGTNCTQLGASMMTSDHKNIATCLQQDTGTTLVWKAMTASDSGKDCGGTPNMYVWQGSCPNCSSWYQVIGEILLQCANGSIRTIKSTCGCYHEPSG